MTRYRKGDMVTCHVTGIENYGIFVGLDEYNNGLIHISEISDSYVRNPADYVRIGDTIRALVIEDEDENSFQVKLSIKNIDYHINNKKRHNIKETKQGFNTLKEMIPIWMKAKK